MSTPKTRAKNSNGLTWLQQAFVQAYVGAAQGNATEAARIAGYKADRDNSLAIAGTRNLANVKIRKAIDQKRAIAQANTGMDLDWWRDQQRKVLEMSLADGDRANANTALRSLALHLGAYEAGQGRSSSAPTIVINMPEQLQAQSQPRLVDSVVLEQDQDQDST